jgi:hypothetical protein
MKTLISRLTMRRINFLFTDIVDGEGVHLYEDKFGQQWMANYPFFFWCFRVKYLGNK